MASYADDTEQRIRRIIRDTVQLDPLVSLRTLQEVLRQQNIDIKHLDYISKLRKKAHREALQDVSAGMVKERILLLKESFRMTKKKLQEILYWTSASGIDKPNATQIIQAARSLILLDIAVFNSELESGIYAGKSDGIDLSRRFAPLPEELRQNIVRAFGQWGRAIKNNIVDGTIQPIAESSRSDVKPIQPIERATELAAANINSPKPAGPNITVRYPLNK